MLDRKKIIVAVSLGILGFLVLLVFLFTLTQGNSQNKAQLPNMAQNIAQNNDSKIKLKLAQVELANTPAIRERGLMYRESMCKECGMLFEFEQSKEQTFWMKNTKISLDMIFMDENGKITKIFDNTVPENTQILYKGEAKYVLELNGGEAKNLNLNQDNVIDILELKKKTIRL